MDSLNIYESLILLKFLNMKYNMFAIARSCQKTIEIPATAYFLSCESLSDCTKRQGFYKCLDLSGLPDLLNLRLVIKSQIQCWQAGWRKAQRINLSNTGCQNKMVDVLFHTPV